MNILKKTVQWILSGMIVCSLIVPSISSISYCNPMEEIMLVSCCDDVHEERGLSLSNPDCCDEISLPASDKEFVDQFTVPAFVAVKQKGFHPEFFFGFSVQSEGRSKQPYQARGPPPDGPALYIYYCSYLI